MLILSDIYERIIRCPPVPPETGAMLGIKDGIVCDYCFDRGLAEVNRAVYTPDIEKLNAQIRRWADQDILFGGIAHSHPFDQEKLSAADIEYIHAIFRAMPRSTEYLYFPIVLPDVEMVPFKAICCNGMIHIYEDKIIEIKGV